MKQSKCKSGGEYLATFFFLWVTVVMPFYYERAYFNILQAKGRIYIVGAVIALVWCLFLVFIYKKKKTIDNSSRIKWDVTSYGIVLLGVIALVSSMCSGAFVDSFFGMKGWCVGGFAFLSLAIMYVMLTRNLQIRPNLWLPVIIANNIVFIIGILHGAGVDVFHLHSRMLSDQVFKYITTIGNLNWYVGYLSLLVPMMAIFYISCSDKKSRAIYLEFMILACMNLVLCGSDGAYLGFGFCAFFMIPYVMDTEVRIRRACVLIILYGISILLVSVCPCFAEKAESIHGISGVLLEPKAAVLVILAGVIGVIVSMVKSGMFFVKNKIPVTVILEGVFGCVAAYHLYNMVRNFGDHWGTNRGKTWMYSMELFQKFSWKEKCIGVGPEMLLEPYKQLSQWFERTIVSAHSEPIQLLLTTGIIGLFCWMVIWGSIFVSYFRKKVWKTDNIAFFLPLAAYFGQSFVNGPQIVNIALLYVMMAVWHIVTHEESSERILYK